MRELYALETMSATDSLRVAEVQESSSYLNRSLRSVASASMRVGHLVRQAMGLFGDRPQSSVALLERRLDAPRCGHTGFGAQCPERGQSSTGRLGDLASEADPRVYRGESRIENGYR